MMSDSYLAGFNAWIAQTTQLLREHRWYEIDVTHLIEEVEDLGKSERRAITSQLTLSYSICSSGNTNRSAVLIVG